jgi:phage gp45-like
VLASVSRAELQRAAAGREVLVLCEGGDPARPVIIGLLEDPAEAILALAAGEEHTLTAEGAAEHQVFRATGSITLVCGEASLTLHADGRVVTRGVNVVSVASEQQRIQGAVVRIN